MKQKILKTIRFIASFWATYLSIIFMVYVFTLNVKTEKNDGELLSITAFSNDLEQFSYIDENNMIAIIDSYKLDVLSDFDSQPSFHISYGMVYTEDLFGFKFAKRPFETYIVKISEEDYNELKIKSTEGWIQSSSLK